MRAWRIVCVQLILATSAWACSIEINEIARFINNAETIVVGEIVSADTSIYTHPEAPDFSVEVAESAVMRVAHVLKGEIVSNTMHLDFDPGEPDWVTSCGPYLEYYGYRPNMHYLLMLGSPQSDGSYRKRGLIGQSIIRLPESDAQQTALNEYVRYVSRTRERAVQVSYAGPDVVGMGQPADIDVTVTNHLSVAITAVSGVGPHARSEDSHGVLNLDLERLGGGRPQLRVDRPDSALAIAIGAGQTQTFTVRLAEYFDLQEGSFGFEESLHLGTTAQPGGPMFRDFWGNFAPEYRFEVVRVLTAIEPGSWARIKRGAVR